MDFYQHQDSARRNTALLIALFITAVVALIIVTVVFTTAFVHYFQLGSGIHLEAHETGRSLWQVWLGRVNPELVLGVAAVVVATVFVASQFKAMQLRRGGEAVAAAMDGELLNRDLATSQQKLLLNVVEEMAIASGMPVPAVYLFAEPSINAFAAGYRPTDAVIGITQGALDTLTREQLQGVIAHEFSHILHGDMRLNMRLISLLSGITIIGTAGHMLMRSSQFSSSRRSDNKRGAAMAFGLGLMIIGFAGTFFGKLIMAATSRQREFLADASAVQYTRNPQGIAGALQAIQNNAYGSQWQHANAAEFSHLFFGQGMSGLMSRVFATHPPLAQRIQRISPLMAQGNRGQIASAAQPTEPVLPGYGAQPDPATRPSDVTTSAFAGIDPLAAGMITPAAISAAQTQLAAMPAAIAQQTRDIFTARAFVYGMLLNPMTPEEQAFALERLATKSHPAVFKRLQASLATAQTLNQQQQWLALLESLPTLKQLSRDQQRIFIANVKYLVEHDKKVTLFEWCIFELAKQTCMPVNVSIVRELASSHLTNEVSQLLSFVAHSNWVDLGTDEKRFIALCAQYPNLRLIDKSALNFRILSACVRRLHQLAPLEKPKLLKAVVTLMQGDGRVSDNEIMLLKTLSLCLDCPMPATEA
ncbi:M48 family metallopeptidase [Halioxenophilus aromaticivorans]|uniref:M48 family metallopeptidase n=1 Tax=Halioxenophilus aromaticivorans TaxID=1306992 RepID=A0AAV3TY39_9ALTE